jgi:hypothetical protein
MTIKFSNNAISTLASGINNSATSITVASGDGAKFPSLTGSEYFRATLIDASNNLEIVKVTARSSDVLTVTRAQESTTARAFSSGDRIELRITAQSLLDAATTLTSLAANLDANSSTIDMNGNEFILDADGDTSITADTDDQVDIKIGGTDRVVIKSTGEIETVSSASDNTLRLESTNAGTTGAGLKLYHNSASPADNDTASIITTQGKNDAAEDVNYSEIHTQILDVSDGTEDARMEFHLMRAGTLTENMRLNETGDCHFDGDVIAFSTSISDVALKSDIQMIPNALDKIDEIQGYTFTRHNGQKSAGIIAQELEKVLPEAVREKELALVDGKTYKTVEYDAIHGLLINCIKELKDQIKELKDGITK